MAQKWEREVKGQVSSRLLVFFFVLVVLVLVGAFDALAFARAVVEVGWFRTEMDLGSILGTGPGRLGAQGREVWMDPV